METLKDRKLNEIETIDQIKPALQKKIQRGFSLPCEYDYRFYEQQKNKQNEVSLIKTNDIESVFSLLDEILDCRIVNYAHGSLMYNRLFNILQTRKNANKAAQLFNVLARYYFYESNDYYVTKFYKNLSEENKNKLNKMLNDYIVYEFNACIENYNSDIELELEKNRSIEVKKVDIHALKWFDSMNANTYHGVIVYINDDIKLNTHGIIYGYGTQYITTAFKLMRQNGFLENDKYQYDLQKKGIEVNTSERKALKRDLSNLDNIIS